MCRVWETGIGSKTPDPDRPEDFGARSWVAFDLACAQVDLGRFRPKGQTLWTSMRRDRAESWFDLLAESHGPC